MFRNLNRTALVALLAVGTLLGVQIGIQGAALSGTSSGNKVGVNAHTATWDGHAGDPHAKEGPADNY